MAQSDNLLFMQNPELATALRKRRMGEALMQQGMDASPVQHWAQGAARLAQALLGGYQARDADNEIKAAGEKRQALLAKLLSDDGMPAMGGQPAAAPPQMPMTAPPPGPVSRMPLAPPDLAPFIEEQARARGIPPALATSLFATESNFNPTARNARTGAFGIGQVLASTAAQPGFGMQPISEADLADPRKAIPWSLDYLKARGGALGVQDFNDPQQAARALRAYGENTDEYERKVLNGAGMLPQPGMQMAAAAAPASDATNVQAPQMGGASGMPSPQELIAKAERATRRAQVAALANEAPLAQQLHNEAAMYRQLALQRQPQPTEEERIALAAGLRPGTPEYQSAMQAILARRGMPPQTTVNNMPENYATKKAIDDWQDAKKTVAGAARRSTLFDTAINVLDNDAFSPGATAELRLAGARFLQDLGLPTNAPAGEVLKAVQRQLELANTPQGQGQITENERVLIRELLPVLSSTKEGLRMMIDATRLLDARDREVFNIYNESARANGGVPSLLDINEKIAALPPALPPEMTARLNQWRAGEPSTNINGPGSRPPLDSFRR